MPARHADGKCGGNGVHLAISLRRNDRKTLRTRPDPAPDLLPVEEAPADAIAWDRLRGIKFYYKTAQHRSEHTRK